MGEKGTHYALRTHLNLPFDVVRRKIESSLMDVGLGALTEIDVTETIKKKLEVDSCNYWILGGSNRPVTYRALRANLDEGLLLPCNVILYEDDDGTEVVFLDPLTVLGVDDRFGPDVVADETNSKLKKVVKVLADLVGVT